jgi:tryptophan synthase alpha subunit
MGKIADAIVVGSSIVQTIADKQSPEAVSEQVTALASALK